MVVKVVNLEVSALPQDTQQVRWRGSLRDGAPRPGTCRPCRWLAGRTDHSWSSPSTPGNKEKRHVNYFHKQIEATTIEWSLLKERLMNNNNSCPVVAELIERATAAWNANFEGTREVISQYSLQLHRKQKSLDDFTSKQKAISDNHNNTIYSTSP